MKKKNVLSILLLIVLIAGCSSGAQFFPADKAQTDGSKITYSLKKTNIRMLMNISEILIWISMLVLKE
jgi:PBP1b-binding outer membrane lipoprotein LpoB